MDFFLQCTVECLLKIQNSTWGENETRLSIVFCENTAALENKTTCIETVVYRKEQQKRNVMQPCTYDISRLFFGFFAVCIYWTLLLFVTSWRDIAVVGMLQIKKSSVGTGVIFSPGRDI